MATGEQRRRIVREVDGEHIEGRQQHVFVRNGEVYVLSALYVYGDGIIECPAATEHLSAPRYLTLADLRGHIESGRITPAPEPGARVVAHGFGSWRLSEFRPYLTGQNVLDDVPDLIDVLNGRPASRQRANRAAVTYVNSPTEANRDAVRTAYFAVPPHRRRSLGGPEVYDLPIRALITEPGQPAVGEPPASWIVTEEKQRDAAEYYRRLGAAYAENTATRQALRDDRRSPTVELREVFTARGLAAIGGLEVLTHAYPAAVNGYDRSYPSVAHAMAALSTADPQWHDRIADAEQVGRARELAQEAPPRANWSQVRLAVLMTLLRAKFRPASEFAQTLLNTGDGRIVYACWDEDYWNERGANWNGRALELMRAELAAARDGLTAEHTAERTAEATGEPTAEPTGPPRPRRRVSR